MDKVYASYDAISSRKIDIARYFEKYRQILSDEWGSPSHADGKNSISSFMPSSLEEEELQILEDYCRIDKLTVPDEVEKEDTAMKRKKPEAWALQGNEIPKDSGLATLEKIEQIYNSQQVRSIVALRKYIGEIMIKHDKVESDGPFAVPGEDIIVYIKIYEPCQRVHFHGKRLNLTNVIAILGSQTLDKIRNLVDCTTDLSISTEISSNPSTSIGPMAKDVYKSGFFYIEGTFYNDLSDPANEDNSKVIRDWAVNHDLGPFTTARMDECRIDSLSVRFGYPWVYQHQGDCEHLIVFSDARLVNSDDELAICAYPRIHRVKQRRTRFCIMCSVSTAHWIVINSDKIPHDPCYMCDLCFKSYNYIDGKKIGSFQAYRYPDDVNLCNFKPSSTNTNSSELN